MVNGLNAIDGVGCPAPGGAFYAMASLPVDDSEKFCQWLLESYSYKNTTVMMAPAQGFYATKGLGTNEVRLAYVLEQSKLKLALEIIENALNEYPGRIEIEDRVERTETA